LSLYNKQPLTPSQKKDIIMRRETSRCKDPGSGVEGGGVTDSEGEGRK
jgi:hypothetical protein